MENIKPIVIFVKRWKNANIDNISWFKDMPKGVRNKILR
jgi:hypothetical protein